MNDSNRKISGNGMIMSSSARKINYRVKNVSTKSEKIHNGMRTMCSGANTLNSK